MIFEQGFYYIVGEAVDLKIIDIYEGSKDELPYYWFEIISKNNNRPVGKVSIRIGSNYHSYYNGNIGYEVDEMYRGHNYAYFACLSVLKIAKYHGMKQLHLTCDADNTPSWKTIERLGGKLLEEVVPPKDYIFYRDNMPVQKIYLLELE